MNLCAVRFNCLWASHPCEASTLQRTDIYNFIYIYIYISKADATTFKEGYIMTLSLCQTGHYSRTFLLSFGGLSKLIGQRKLAWKPTIGAFHVFFLRNLPQPLASLCRIWTNSSRQVVLNCCCQGHLLFSFYLEFGVSCDCNIVPIF